MSEKIRNIHSKILVLVIMISAVLSLKDLNRDSIIPYANYLTAFVQLCIPFFFLATLRWKSPVRTSKQFILFAGMYFIFVFAFSSSLWSDYPALVIQRSILVFVPFFVISLVVWTDQLPIESFLQISKWLVFFVALLSLIGVFLFFFGQESSYQEGRIQSFAIGPFTLSQKVYGIPPFLRISSLTGNPNSFAQSIIVALPLLLCLYHTQRINLQATMILFGLMSIALLLTISRTGIGSALIALAVYFLVFSNKFWTRFWFIFFGIIILAGGILFAIEYLPEFQDSQRFSFELNERDIIWSELISSIKNNWSIGVGFGVSFEEILFFSGLSSAGHNFHLQTLAEIGVVGYFIIMLLYLFALLTIARNIGKKIHSANRAVQSAIFAILTTLIFHQTFEGNLLRVSFVNLVWVYLLAVVMHKDINNGLQMRHKYKSYVPHL